MNILQVSVMARMIPSPDWFIGVDSFDLCVDGNWIDSITIEVCILANVCPQYCVGHSYSGIFMRFLFIHVDFIVFFPRLKQVPCSSGFDTNIHGIDISINILFLILSRI